MSRDLEQTSRLERRLGRERRARAEAERLLEAKSAELFEANHELERLLATQGRTLERYRQGMARLVDALLASGDDHLANAVRLLREGCELLGATGALFLAGNEREAVPGSAALQVGGEQLPTSAKEHAQRASDSEEWREGEVTYVVVPVDIAGRRAGMVLMKLAPDEGLDEFGWMMAELVVAGVATELERAEAKSEIRMKEQRYESLFHASVDSIVIVDFEGQILNASHSALMMFGLTREWMLRNRLSRFVAPDSLDRAAAAFRQVREAGRCHFELNLLRADGSVFPAELVANVFEVGGERQVYAILRDLTQRKKRQAAVLERERKFRAVFEQSQDGIVLHDFHGSIIDVNVTLCSLLGQARNVLMEKAWPDWYPETSRESYQQAMEEVRNTGSARFECEFHRKDGSRFVAEVWANAFELGEDRLVQAIVRDVTARRRRELEIREAMEAAELANETKSVFLATMSHEIRTPLNGILGFANLLDRSGMSEDQSKAVEMIRKSGDVLLGLINNILDFSRAESGRLSLKEKIFDPAAFLRETVELQRGVAEGKDLELRVEVAHGVPSRIRAARTELRQIMLNLIGNAVKFTDAGSVVASLDCPGPGCLRFAVRDTGIGFPEGDEEKLFDPFFQVDLSSTRRHGGTGLGLAICRRLVEAMDGEIRASHGPDGGSRFDVELPLKEAHESQDPTSRKASPEVAIKGGGKRILVVEDHAVNSRLLKMMLEKLDFQVEVAENGRLALALLDGRDDFDLILMDMRMPEMDGLEATQRLRAGEAGEQVRSLPVVAVTANAMEADREACREAGMDHYLSKPVNAGELEQVLLEVIHPDHGSGI